MANKNTINEVFEEHVNHYPNDIAVVNGIQSLTYNELNKRANQLAHHLQKLGLKPDTPVALCMDRSFDFLIALIAILKAGGAYLPIDFTQPEERLLFLLNNSQTPILITKSIYHEKFITYQGILIFLDRDEKNIKQQPTNNLHIKTTPEHLAYIIYTSGSTGEPKGVLIEHRSVINYGKWFVDYTQCTAQQRIDFSANPIFDMSVTTTIVPLMFGLTIVICDTVTKKEVQNYLHHLEKSDINIIKLTPSYFKVLLQEAKHNFSALKQLKSIILGGENLSVTECQSWLALYPEHNLFNEYGPTETTVAVSTYKVSIQNCASLAANVPIGTLGPNMSCIILDANKFPVPDGDTGELYISGLCLARGYLNKPELTNQQFIIQNNTRFYKTGDLCKMRSDGVIEYLGRIDEQVKIRGFRIEPGEINKLLSIHPAIKEVAVVAQKDLFNEQRLVAYFILKNNDLIVKTNQIREYLQKHLPDYMIPTVFIKVNSFPLTANGKLDKAALPMPLMTASHNYTEPVTALEIKLTEIWSEELGVQLIGVHDDFFDLGGHSLSAARIVAKINNELGRKISLHDFYKASSIAKLVPIIKQTKKVIKKKKTRNKSSYQKISNIPLNDFQFMLWLSNTFEPKAKKLNIVARKRVQGRLNKDAVEFAFQAIIKRHEALTYQILKFRSVQRVSPSPSFNLVVHNIESHSVPDRENKLLQSMSQLTNLYPWPKKTPLIVAKLFYLQGNESELQICIPHLISDDYCMDILFSELSKYYQQYELLTLEAIEIDSSFKEAVLRERNTMKTHLEQDILFWKEYLQDSSLFAFPKEHIVRNMKADNISYSTYSLIPQDALNQLKQFCERNHISIHNALCAVIALALRNSCGHYQSKTPYSFMNIIHSTRDNPIYDNTIGCFLRVEPTKIKLDSTSTLNSLAQEIRQSTIDTSRYQQCSNLVKLSSISSFEHSPMKSFLIKIFTPLYARLLKIPSMYRKILQQCGSRLMSFKRTNKFLINLNIRDNFTTVPSNNSKLFGFNKLYVKNNRDDLLAIDYVFEASFFHDHNEDAHYLVISANLKPEFREKIIQEVFHTLNSIKLEKMHDLNRTHESAEQLL